MANEFTYRADHIGPLLIPAALADARRRHADGEIDLDALHDAENAAVKAAVDMQRAAGIAVTSDGGFRRGLPDLELDGCTLAETEAAVLRSLSRRPIKVAVPAARPRPAEPFDQTLARASVVRAEIEALIAAGVDYIQLDAPGYAVLFQGEAPAGESHNGLDGLLQLDAAALSGIARPERVRIGVYFVPPGNAHAQQSDGDGAATERLFQTLPVDRFILPFAGAGDGFELLQRVPKDKLVVLGLVGATKSASEDVDTFMSAIDQAAKVIDGDNLALSPATGFSAGDGLSEADQRRKLELIADVATRWWGFAM